MTHADGEIEDDDRQDDAARTGETRAGGESAQSRAAGEHARRDVRQNLLHVG